MERDRIGFDGRVALVTGAGGGLGRAYALELAARGALVVVNDVSGTAGQVVDEIAATGGSAIADAGDIVDPAGRAGLVAAALAAWGRIDVLVNNAGIGGGGPFGETSAADFDRVVEVDAVAAVELCRAVWPTMVAQRYGRIVNITSHASFGPPVPGAAAYLYARAAHLGLTIALAVDGRPHGILVNCLMPAAQTRMAPTYYSAHEEYFTTGAAARAVGYLASDQTEVTGEIFHTGGGLVARVALMVNAGVPGLAAAEDIRDSIADIRDMTAAVAPTDVDDALAPLIARTVTVPPS